MSKGMGLIGAALCVALAVLVWTQRLEIIALKLVLWQMAGDAGEEEELKGLF